MPTDALNPALSGTTRRIRVYLPTYRRPALLPRAIASLQAQSHTDWICELHNDDPLDDYPCELVKQIADPRIELHTHARNLGAVATFNHFYQPVDEAFYSILEDDNWWEPVFLEKMLEALALFPEATLAWCNQYIWQERPDGRWEDTRSLVNPPGPTKCDPLLVHWGHLRQVMGGLHANGAMLMRTHPGTNYTTPDIPQVGMELYRDRMVPYPFVYVPQPYAHFSRTLQTSRNEPPAEWGAFLVALASTFLRHGSFSCAQQEEIWAHYKNQHPPMTNELLAVALICKEARPFVRFAGLTDWFRFLLNATRHPSALLHKFRVRTEHPDWWDALDRLTAARFAETAGKPTEHFPPLF